MDAEALAEARQKVQEAESRARLAMDPTSKKLWENAAARWRERLAKLDGSRPQIRRALRIFSQSYH
jgi:hypothetical protein